MTEYAYCIIGFGIAGQLLTLELLQHGISQRDICICDKNFLGGALATHYGSVESNTPWWKTRKALELYSQWSKEVIQEGDLLYTHDQCMPLRDISRFCSNVANAASYAVNKLTTHVKNIQHIDSIWQIQHTFGTICCKTLFLATGAESKSLELSKASIPLSIALDKMQLTQHVNPAKDTILVFGTSHSGTILLHNLQELGVKTIGVYKTTKPFIFARDGAYDGIKEGSEKIADSILQGNYINVSLVSWNDPIAVHKSIVQSTKCIYATGFETNLIQGASSLYDPATAALKELPNLYGFGIAYPGITILDGKSYVDVSVLSFQDQIRRCLPIILEKEETRNK
jgi:pyruvate/2-oxoglutarate dehydrogenase complex dihydrolipoamide dehydrogenase (E3) component